MALFKGYPSILAESHSLHLALFGIPTKFIYGPNPVYLRNHTYLSYFTQKQKSADIPGAARQELIGIQ